MGSRNPQYADASEIRGECDGGEERPGRSAGVEQAPGPPQIRCLSPPVLEAPTRAIADPVPAQIRRASMLRHQRSRTTDICLDAR